jgi:hypothetical protein
MRSAWIAAGALAAALAAAAGAAPRAAPVPTPVGKGPLFRPSATTSAVARGDVVGRHACSRAREARFGVHLELFAHGRVVIVPAGIGMAPPLKVRGARVLSGRCSYPARTREPTGVVELARSARLTLGELFEIWGRPLDERRLLGFRAPAGRTVRAYVGGRRWRGDPRAIPLSRHAQIVLQVGPVIPPHDAYHFPAGL